MRAKVRQIQQSIVHYGDTTLFFADQLPVYLVARTRTQMAALALCGAIAWLAWFVRRYVSR